MLLVGIDSSENLENLKHPDSRPLNSTSTGRDDGAVPLPRACGGVGPVRGLSSGCPATTRMRAETGPLRRGWREGELRTLPVIRRRRRDQQGSTHIPSGRSARSADAFPRKVDGFLTRLAILCARKGKFGEPSNGYTSSQDSDKDSTGT